MTKGQNGMYEGFGEHLKAKMDAVNPNSVPSAVGIMWYSRENFDGFMSLFSDSDDLPSTYDDWLVKAEHAEKQVQSQGMKVVRVETDPETFRSWCNERGYSNIDTHARMGFGSFKAMERLGNDS
ncbi:MAG: hypothetical protein KDB00_10960 [Planctomycetales bacterium]|nr:hypothetical protein [Planctomycetales bacterium]